MTQPLTMYTTPWCGFCKRLKRQLAADGIEMAEIDIEQDPGAAEYVMSVNGGFQTVPTVVFPDGSVPDQAAPEVGQGPGGGPAEVDDPAAEFTADPSRPASSASLPTRGEEA